MVESPQPVGSSLGPSPGIFSCPGRYLVRRCSCVITTPCAYLTGCSNQWQPYNGWCASNERFQELPKTRLKMIFASNRCQNHHIWGMGMVVLSPLKVHCELYHSHLIGWCKFFFYFGLNIRHVLSVGQNYASWFFQICRTINFSGPPIWSFIL